MADSLPGSDAITRAPALLTREHFGMVTSPTSAGSIENGTGRTRGAGSTFWRSYRLDHGDDFARAFGWHDAAHLTAFLCDGHTSSLSLR